MSDTSCKREFLCNSLLIKALLQFIPSAERSMAKEWLTKLEETEENALDTKIRNEYAFYLLVNVQNGTLSQPFDKQPAAGKLKPLCRVLPDYVLEDVMRQIKSSRCRFNKMLNNKTNYFEMPDLRCEPPDFQNQQPRPRKGIFAHFAAFSNYDEVGKKNSK